MSRWHIPTKAAPLACETPRIEVRRDYARCIGCGLCAQACLYGAHSREPAAKDFTRMAEPAHAKCVGCHRCVNECPRDALELRPHPDFAALGDGYYTADSIETLLYEAETGRVPVSGAGYRGPFAGAGFDAVWTDMSEIVRPTRDGIHGRETISTEVELGRRPERLEFSADGRLETRLAPLARLGVPFLFNPLPFTADRAQRLALARVVAAVAAEARSLVILDEDVAADVTGERGEAPLPRGEAPLPRGVRLSSPASSEPSRYEGFLLVEFKDSPASLEQLAALRACAPEAVASVWLPASRTAAARAVELAKAGAPMLHLAADPHGRWVDAPDRHLLACLREVERALVEAGLRDQLTLAASGGIGRAEHVPKAMLFGADAVGLDAAWLIALGMRRFNGDKGVWSPGDADLSDPERARQRLRNLVNSWRDQLLEVMGAMGIREARRLAGEEGRAMLHEDLHREFLALFEPPALKEFDPTYG